MHSLLHKLMQFAFFLHTEQ